MPTRSSIHLDTNQLAKRSVAETTSRVSRTTAKNQAAVDLGRLGGRKGGIARARSLSSNQRSEIARKAALIRWAKLANE
jgi:hypothetical protein